MQSTALIAFSLSVSLAVAGCVASNPELLQQKPLVPTSSVSQTVSGPLPQARPLPQSLYRYDWTTDRILGAQGFRTQAFVDSVKPAMSDPAIEQQVKEATSSGGLTSDFAKNLPGSDNSEYLPNTPVVIGTDAYYLTSSLSSTNVFALNDNGSKIWDLSLHDNGGRFIGTSAGLGAAGGVNTLYALSSTGRLYAINAATGLVRSFVDIIGEEFEFSSPFVISGATDNIYVAGSKQGRIYKYTFNGTSFTQSYSPKVVSSSNTGKFKASPVVTGAGKHIYIGSEEGKFYKIREDNGAIVSTLDLTTLPRSTGCQVSASVAVDATLDVGIVSCGSFLYKVRLNDASNTTNLSLAAQSPLLEIRELAAFKPSRVLGPNTVNRTLPSTNLLREPLPTDTTFSIDQRFGFKSGDFLRIITRDGLSLYGTLDQVTVEGAVTLKESKLFPLPSPTPNPATLLGGESVSVVNLAVRPTPLPSPSATPSPTPSPTAAGADQVFQFKIGNPEGLAEGDSIIFTNLPNTPVATLCSSTNASCDKDATGTNRHKGIEVALDDDGKVVTDSSKFVYQLTVPDPGGTLKAAVQAKLHTDKFVPFEKITNRVMGVTNSTIDFELGSVAEFATGQIVRVTHNNTSLRGRFEYGVVASVDTTNRRIKLTSALTDAPGAGDKVDIMEPNTATYGRVLPTQAYSNGNILSSPVLRGNGQHVYLQHGNVLFELDYSSDTKFKEESNYLVLQAARIDQSNLSFTALSRSVPLVLSNDKLLTVDSDPSGKTGIFLNRALLPLNANLERLNDVFPISAPNAAGELPKRAETRPVPLGAASNFVVMGGGNGIVYKLHKDMAW
ncbi:hypothetical protein COW36_21965 [bacterium (Candidatus Blackallbacteria) CG17_big_fil_post_rev_8_21_14_2_50_48_46]|uniref:Uncharacterized protein n=1 Tax=bacterium (Candidatus Blackallbacteria) CG17_big_fil_post_rev_8_21_14_2_50_48_46 TaxID=2014261 RepID=A0A2M7FY80_9BACT|nr:MAG: hypothetical protein COW64_13395 [bacterium (Candidatus Blackallbacteria) CG18_big_fil_WC_8_21_14_2_50_49_26]PIW14285.1 MAG: hypothetical protein COW36_21965 [bacterium (Candidatus Blackallbacteria) CG17_big_fil_post_rev_8_21_14_2_50_48_46]PIW45554.1 MAG: hypothetical protein COW20_19570 [bacterium (Candidatus Blackallbacteria) CG13_big_fil_rev_8_21_14_2_50_49_14]